MGIARSLLSQKYGSLPLPSYWGNLYGNFARFYYQILPKFVLKYYPKSTIWVIYPCILNFGDFIYEVTYPEHYSNVREETEIFSYFGIMFLIEIQ